MPYLNVLCVVLFFLSCVEYSIFEFCVLHRGVGTIFLSRANASVPCAAEFGGDESVGE